MIASRRNFSIDRRSGTIGGVAGDIVLKHLEKEFDEKIEKEKGAIFSTETKVLLRRLCGSKEYLQSEEVHLSNLSIVQHKDMKQQRRKFFYLYITVEEESIEYWLIPSAVINKIIPKLGKKKKPNDRFVRIYEKKYGEYTLGNKNITKYHHSIAKPINFSKLVKKEDKAFNKSAPYKIIDGRKWVPVKA